MSVDAPARPVHRVLVLGGGFGGVETVQALEKRLGKRDDVEIWLVSRENFQLFTPLLPEVCSGNLEPRHVVNPLRGMVKRESTWCITATVEAIDTAERVVRVLGGDGDRHHLRYDTLVLALGGETATFGIPGITEFAVGMKTLGDAFALRNRIIEMLERADIETDAAERRAHLTFVVGGGGFSGVETAGEIEDFIRRVRQRYYPRIAESDVRGYLVELNPTLLAEMGSGMGTYAHQKLAERGYQILIGTPLKEVRYDGVFVGEDRRFIPARTVVWTGGVKPSPIVKDAGVDVDRAGRAVTAATMETSVPGVYAIGDCAAIPDPDDPDGRPFAPTAQNAVREAKRLADNILARIDGREPKPFRYRTIGTLASIGRHTGVGMVLRVKVRGRLAWLMWRGYYWSRVPGLNNKVRVGLDWLLTALFGSDSVQLKVDPGGGSGMSPSGVRRPAQASTGEPGAE